MKFRPQSSLLLPIRASFFVAESSRRFPSFRDASIFREGKDLAAKTLFLSDSMFLYLTASSSSSFEYEKNSRIIYIRSGLSSGVTRDSVLLGRCRDNRVTFGVVTGQANTVTTCNPRSTPSNLAIIHALNDALSNLDKLFTFDR